MRPSRSATPRNVLCVPPSSDESSSLTQPAQVSCSETCCGAVSLNSLSKRVKTLLAACCAFPAPSHRSANGRSRPMRKASSLAVLPCCGLLAPKHSARSMVLKHLPPAGTFCCECRLHLGLDPAGARKRSEEHTSELQSLRHLVCRLLL